MAEQPLLDVRDLAVSTRGGTPLVDGISFGVSPGEQVGLIGESGSGKSLTAFALCGLLPRGLTAAGSLRFADLELVGASETTWNTVRGSQIALVLQDPGRALDPLLRIGTQVAAPLRRHRGLSGTRLDAAVRAALTEVALPDLDRIIRAYPHELSGGQHQRIAVAMALACRPLVLIADEPTTALDVTVQAEVVTLLTELTRNRGMALIFISHDIALVSQAVDRALVMKDGRLVAQGPVDDLVTDPQDPYAHRLVTAARRLEQALSTGSIE